MEEKKSGIFVSNVFLQNINNLLKKHCHECKLQSIDDNALCYNCCILEVVDNVRFLSEVDDLYERD